jgi:hypothetical protein
VAVAGIQTALPQGREVGRLSDPANGYIERGGATLSWDLDPRTGPVELEGEHLLVSGHDAIKSGDTIEWRCDKTQRLFRLTAKEPEKIAAETKCHAQSVQKFGEVPSAASAILGPGWRLANRSPTSISWLGGDAVLTLFAGQQLQGPRSEEAARRAAPEWILAAGLKDVESQKTQEATGPQGHPGFQVSGAATLQGRKVSWTLLFWRCLQRQRSFVAVVFSEHGGDEGVLRAPRCHG